MFEERATDALHTKEAAEENCAQADIEIQREMTANAASFVSHIEEPTHGEETATALATPASLHIRESTKEDSAQADIELEPEKAANTIANTAALHCEDFKAAEEAHQPPA